MELLVKNLKDILNDELSLLERGILITIALYKDSDPNITWAKFKAKTKISLIKNELMKLHQKKYIKWSGYQQAIKSLEKSKTSPDIQEVISFMNELYRRKFDPNSEATVKFLRGRLEEHGVEIIKKVVANRYSEWKDDSMMQKHLNPTTIFRPSKFEKYLEETLRTRVGESFVAASNINLKNGDEITSEVANTFIDEDTYNIKIYQVDEQGNRRANGISATRYGKDIKKAIKIQDRQDIREYRYYYKSN